MGQLDDALVQELVDKQQLLELVLRVARAVDRCDGDLLLSCYHEDGFDDHGSYKGDPRGLLAFLKTRAMNPASGPVQHAITNALFEVRGDTAFGECYGEARWIKPDGSVTRGLNRYIDRFERRDGVWRIAHRRVVLEAARPGLDPTQFVIGTRDRTDPSYDRD